jgi:hypothetical protein
MNRRAAVLWLVICVMAGVGAGAIVVVGLRDTAPAVPTGEKRITQLPDPTDVVDLDLMIALGQAKNFHHKAKVYMSDANTAEAIAQVQAILAIEFPPGSPEGEDVRLDARALMAKLLAERGKIDEAMTVVDQGIGGATRDSFFLANLYTVKGVLHEERATQLAAQGPATKARVDDENRAALTAFDKSLAIIEKLQKQAVEDRKRKLREDEGKGGEK